jgi:hypothetical protein
MAMFAALGDKFVCGILKQIAADYSLDYKEMKAKYTGVKSFDLYTASDHTEKELEELDLEEAPSPVKAKKAKEPKTKAKAKETLKEAPKTKAKAKETKKKEPEPKGDAPMALSKMKKQDLIDELDSLGIDTDKLTVVKLKELVKEARDKSGVVVAKGGRKPKAIKEIPVHNHEPLTEEPVDDCALCQSHGDITATETEEFEVKNQESLEARLAAILAEADEEEEEGDEAEEEDADEELDLEDGADELEEED